MQETAHEVKSVLPALEKAVVALSALDKADVAELRWVTCVCQSCECSE